MASEVSAVIAEKAFDLLDAPIKRVTGPHTPVPYSRDLENLFLPNEADVIATTKKLLGE
jgi:pyruvate dehydrogenase E1 component beta subunit